jgi:LmbE family N-acetylglucosaminyl deacetylase
LSQAGLPDLGRVARLRLGRARTVVVLAAHLDEELCAAGGLLASLAASSAEIRVLAVTDGDGASRPDRGAAARLGRRRARLAVAYQLLGLDPERYRLGLRCGRVAGAEGDVLAAISELLGFADPAGLLCLAPWIHDTHPDHAAVGHAATRACQAYRTRLLYYSITQWEHPRHPGMPDLPLQRARRFPLSEVLATRKDQALAHLTRPRRRGAPAPSGPTPSPGGPACEVFIT